MITASRWRDRAVPAIAARAAVPDIRTLSCGISRNCADVPRVDRRILGAGPDRHRIALHVGDGAGWPERRMALDRRGVARLQRDLGLRQARHRRCRRSRSPHTAGHAAQRGIEVRLAGRPSQSDHFTSRFWAAWTASHSFSETTPRKFFSRSTCTPAGGLPTADQLASRCRWDGPPGRAACPATFTS